MARFRFPGTRLPSLSCLLLLLTSVCVSTGPEDSGDGFQMPLPMPASGNKPPKVYSYLPLRSG